jgi:hypothetical protein
MCFAASAAFSTYARAWLVITAQATPQVFLLSLSFMRAGDLLPASLQQMDIREINFVQRRVWG